ncbi:flagellin [Hyphomonas johnsonii]|uniref:Putative flagellar hook-associated protein FlgL n=1 Tax=Hyphomonas johnsonii MHS-2 TaxID=1280950 RepID=A0A059FNE9_9PROT|nr:flagellin [Hyphomonas johnsonii]KCZ92215.1 putative flagellar hook-associated protein FlgL [Hyphomonas johnsonii MHS-2]
MRIPLPSSLLTSGLSHEIKALREQVGNTSKEAVTGRYADLTAHLSGRISQAMLGKKALDDIAQDRVHLTIREGRLDVAERSLTLVQERANGLSARMQAALGSSDQASKTATARDALGALEESFAALNARYGDRYLFAGDATATPPFGNVSDLIDDVRSLAAAAPDAATFEADLDTYFNTPGGGWRQNIYSGTDTVSDADATPGSHASIINIVRGLTVMALSAPSENLTLLAGDSPTVHTAAETLSAGQTGLTNLRAEVGISQAGIARTKESLDLEETVLTANFNELTARDQYEAASELRELQSNLEASYLLTSRLANLSLLNFLR